jgi:hypothetical protein
MLKFKIPSSSRDCQLLKLILLKHIDCENLIEVLHKISQRHELKVNAIEGFKNIIYIETGSVIKLELHDEKEDFRLDFSLDISMGLSRQWIDRLIIIAVLLGYKDYEVEYN